MKVRILLAGLFLTGCATPLERVISVAGDVPDWFEERRAEVRGEGYPQLTEVPNGTDGPSSDTQTNAVRAVLASYDNFFNDPRAAEPSITKADIIALKEELFAQFKRIEALPDQERITEAEIEAMKALFEPYESKPIDPDG